MKRLSESTLRALPESVCTPAYDRKSMSSGIMHFGPGAFHRGHQAVYIDEILRDDPSWAITEVSLRSTGARDALREQDNLYTLARLGRTTEYQVIGSIKEFLVAPENPQAVIERLSRPTTHIVTSTITEKGYCMTPQGDLDTQRPEIIHDLATPRQPQSAIGFICEALERRRSNNVPPFAVVSCDNMADNGKRVRRAVLQFAEQTSGDLAKWIRDEVRFPCTMVDSITPATGDVIRARVSHELGVVDAWPIQREPFTQWVVEDNFATPRPAWEMAGVTMAQDVRPFEEAKLRLLNGSHSALAYIGLLAGYETVVDAMQNPRLNDYLCRLMENEICVSFAPPEGLNVVEYAAAIRERFENPSIRYMLGQIAWDGSQKIPFRLLGTICDNLRNGRPARLLMIAVAAWMNVIQRVAARRSEHMDPLKDELFAIAGRCTGVASHDVDEFLELKQMFSDDVLSTPGFRDGLIEAYEALGDADLAATVSAIKLAA